MSFNNTISTIPKRFKFLRKKNGFIFGFFGPFGLFSKVFNTFHTFCLYTQHFWEVWVLICWFLLVCTASLRDLSLQMLVFACIYNTFERLELPDPGSDVTYTRFIIKHLQNNVDVCWKIPRRFAPRHVFWKNSRRFAPRTEGFQGVPCPGRCHFVYTGHD